MCHCQVERTDGMIIAIFIQHSHVFYLQTYCFLENLYYVHKYKNRETFLSYYRIYFQYSLIIIRNVNKYNTCDPNIQLSVNLLLTELDKALK